MLYVMTITFELKRSANEMSIETEKQQEGKEDHLPEWDDTGESILRYEWLKVRYDGP